VWHGLAVVGLLALSLRRGALSCQTLWMIGLLLAVCSAATVGEELLAAPPSLRRDSIPESRRESIPPRVEFAAAVGPAGCLKEALLIGWPSGSRAEASGTPSTCRNLLLAPRLKPRGGAVPPMFGSSPNNGLAFFGAISTLLLLLLLLLLAVASAEELSVVPSFVTSGDEGAAPIGAPACACSCRQKR
jgi:hypothetical protein